ncbi:sporulation protein YqfC [Acididesulfobacillus acetoxydans]|uniref:Sporulation protein YqfC n=1 Tax=Acididesulfobacillus acetoxydans TaxID=1561005 RepID=A0A8S0XDF9_9FIRM|nr:sporulation protein YqfC [Acididesulfobacillus acetoxydans]CAA7603476.1 sporulation protein YqfC [Acididesulfobacillus acetoxydans]CEJ06821.1 spore_yqfC: sporulation protein YqfC [Acididesulfobacillus acetoxydans]
MFGKLQKTMGEVLELPPDVMGDGPKITVTGRKQVYIENYKEIVTFSGEKISLATSEGELYVTGKALVLKTVLPAELQIEGEFISLGYLSDKGGE